MIQSFNDVPSHISTTTKTCLCKPQWKNEAVTIVKETAEREHNAHEGDEQIISKNMQVSLEHKLVQHIEADKKRKVPKEYLKMLKYYFSKKMVKMETKVVIKIDIINIEIRNNVVLGDPAMGQFSGAYFLFCTSAQKTILSHFYLFKMNSCLDKNQLLS